MFSTKSAAILSNFGRAVAVAGRKPGKFQQASFYTYSPEPSQPLNREPVICSIEDAVKCVKSGNWLVRTNPFTEFNFRRPSIAIHVAAESPISSGHRILFLLLVARVNPLLDTGDHSKIDFSRVFRQQTPTQSGISLVWLLSIFPFAFAFFYGGRVTDETLTFSMRMKRDSIRLNDSRAVVAFSNRRGNANRKTANRMPIRKLNSFNQFAEWRF